MGFLRWHVPCIILRIEFKFATTDKDAPMFTFNVTVYHRDGRVYNVTVEGDSAQQITDVYTMLYEGSYSSITVECVN